MRLLVSVSAVEAEEDTLLATLARLGVARDVLPRVSYDLCADWADAFRFAAASRSAAELEPLVETWGAFHGGCSLRFLRCCSSHLNGMNEPEQGTGLKNLIMH